MTKRALVLLLGALVPAGLGPALAHATAAWMAPPVGRAISAFSLAMPAREVVTSSTPARVSGATTVHAKREPAKRRRATQVNAAPQRGILVRRSTVQQAVRRGVRPSAVAVGETVEHPAGLLVTGWGAAGAGFMDGDIITSVGGRTPTSVDDVIAAVAGAYRVERYAVSGRIWRNGETIAATVELPLAKREGVEGSSKKVVSER